MLIDEIIDLAADNEQSISVLLRKCLVLAHQLKNENLKAWATKELNGYSSGDAMPDYRVSPAQAKGDFSGWGGREIHGLAIPPSVLKERHRRWATAVHLSQAIGAYEHTIKDAKPGARLTFPWPTDLTLYYQDRIPLSSGDKLFNAYQEIPVPSVVELVETVRNRVLSFALEIKSEIQPENQPLDRLTPALEKRVNQIFIQQISAGTVNLASASEGASINFQQQNVQVNNWRQLEKALQNSGVSGSELEELSAALESDEETMGSSVTKWIKKMAPKVVSGGVQIGAAVGQAILTELLKKYFGLPS